jgi:hypothetical protein
MHIIEDKANGIVINHSSGFVGEVRIAWYDLSKRPDHGIITNFDECWCSGIDLVAGRFTPVRGPEPPVNVITRAVALAVETYLRNKMESAVEFLFINRGKL